MRLLVQRHPTWPPLVLRRWVVQVVAPVTVLLHHAAVEQTIDVAAVAVQAVVLAPSFTCVPVRAEGVWLGGAQAVAGKGLVSAAAAVE